MKKLKSAVALLVGLYFLVAVLFFAPYYNWTYAKENGFFKWLFLGEIIATGKAIVWPYFTVIESDSYRKTKQKVEDKYFETLDGWVRRGGPVAEVQDTVVGTCGKLVSLMASMGENIALTTFQRDEYHFRTDVCVKMTANRASPQPEFEKPEMVEMICDKSKLELFVKLCKRSGLRKVSEMGESPSPSISSDQKTAEYTDNEYNYAFQFPSGWKMQQPPKTEVGTVRVLLQGDGGAMVMVMILPIEKSVSRTQFYENPRRAEIVDAFMNLTVDKVYKKDAQDLKVTRMVVNEKKVIDSEIAIEIYISTVKFVLIKGKELPVGMSGLHLIPFGKSHMVSFIMTVPVTDDTKRDAATFDKVIGSFHLLGEKPL